MDEVKYASLERPTGRKVVADPHSETMYAAIVSA